MKGRPYLLALYVRLCCFFYADPVAGQDFREVCSSNMKFFFQMRILISSGVLVLENQRRVH